MGQDNQTHLYTFAAAADVRRLRRRGEGAHIAETASLVYTEGQKEGLLSLPSFLHACMGEQRVFFTVLCIYYVQEQHLTALQSVHFVPLTCVFSVFVQGSLRTSCFPPRALISS